MLISELRKYLRQAQEEKGDVEVKVSLHTPASIWRVRSPYTELVSSRPIDDLEIFEDHVEVTGVIPREEMEEIKK